MREQDTGQRDVQGGVIDHNISIWIDVFTIISNRNKAQTFAWWCISEWKVFWNKNKCRAGLDFVRGEIIGWLWFAIGGSHVSDRLLRPHGIKRIIREEMRWCCEREGKLFWLKIKGPILTIWNASIKRETQVTLWADLGRCCYYTGGINDSCARRKSKMGWSEVASLFIGVVWA